MLTKRETDELIRVARYFPYRRVCGVKTASGEFVVFANPTRAQANNYARKNNGTVWELSK